MAESFPSIESINPEFLASLVDTSRVIEVEHIDPALLPVRPIYRALKRAFDFFACLVALIVLAIPIIIVAIAIKIDSPGPVFYRQERLGYAGQPFMLIKFRSMRIDAEAYGAQWAQEHDSRITRLGAFLRKTRIDEIPQFWNVVKGQMSLVGPRPERAIFYEEFEHYIHGFRQRMLVKPGISGLAQVNGGYALKPEEKILLDIEYIKRRNIGLDLKIILKTFGVLFSGTGAR